jgi:tetratricopeptide (TPR) repeat protein
MKRLLIIILFCCLLFVTSAFANPVKNSYSLEAGKKYQEAMQLMKELADREPRHYLANLRTGWLAYLSSNLGLSVIYYQKAVVLAPDAVEPRLGLLLPQIALGNYAQAEANARAALRLDAKNYLARSRLAWALYLAGRFGEAADFYAGLVKDYPSDGEMHLGLAWALLKQGQKQPALAAFRMADTILPGNASVADGIAACGK